MKSTDIFTKVVESPNSTEFVLVLIIIAVVIVLLARPMYKANIKAKQDSMEQWIKRDGLLIAVVTGNTSVMTDLKVTLATMATATEVGNAKCVECKREQLIRFDEIAFKIDSHNDKLVEVVTILNNRSIVMQQPNILQNGTTTTTVTNERSDNNA